MRLRDQTLLSHPCSNSNICKNDVSSNITFAQGCDDEPGSNVISFSHYFLNWSILTTRKHINLAVWLMTQQTRWTSGSAVEVGHFLSVKSICSKFHDIPFLRYIYSCSVPKYHAKRLLHTKQTRGMTITKPVLSFSSTDSLMIVGTADWPVCATNGVRLRRPLGNVD